MGDTNNDLHVGFYTFIWPSWTKHTFVQTIHRLRMEPYNSYICMIELRFWGKLHFEHEKNRIALPVKTTLFVNMWSLDLK